MLPSLTWQRSCPASSLSNPPWSTVNPATRTVSLSTTPMVLLYYHFRGLMIIKIQIGETETAWRGAKLSSVPRTRDSRPQLASRTSQTDESEQVFSLNERCTLWPKERHDVKSPRLWSPVGPAWCTSGSTWFTPHWLVWVLLQWQQKKSCSALTVPVLCHPGPIWLL